MPRSTSCWKLCALLSTVLLTPGCGTIATLSSKSDRWTLYGGVRVDVMAISAKGRFMPRWLLIPLGILDLPLSALFDTLLLPITGLTTAAGR